MDSSPPGPLTFERALGASLEPTLELVDRDQPPTSSPNDTQLVHDVLFEEVDADTEGRGRLALRKRQSTARSRISTLTLFFDRLS